MDNITTINLDACPLQYLSIGYVGETGARPVAFDFSAWAAEYGAGVLQLLLQRPGDAQPYPVLLDIDGETATWTPDETDTAAQGQGQAQLVYTVGGVIVKNAIFRVLIAPSLGAAGDPPEPYENWLARLTAIAVQAQQSAIDAEGSATEAEGSASAARLSADAADGFAKDAESAAEDAAGEAAASETARASAETEALKAEGYAIGKQDGAAVAPGSPYYENNAKFYAELAKQGAVESGFAWFDIDETDGQMYVTITPNLAEDVSFQINEQTGILEVLVYA